MPCGHLVNHKFCQQLNAYLCTLQMLLRACLAAALLPRLSDALRPIQPVLLTATWSTRLSANWLLQLNVYIAKVA